VGRSRRQRAAKSNRRSFSSPAGSSLCSFFSFFEHDPNAHLVAVDRDANAWVCERSSARSRAEAVSR